MRVGELYISGKQKLKSWTAVEEDGSIVIEIMGEKKMDTLEVGYRGFKQVIVKPIKIVLGE